MCYTLHVSSYYYMGFTFVGRCEYVIFVSFSRSRSVFFASIYTSSKGVNVNLVHRSNSQQRYATERLLLAVSIGRCKSPLVCVCVFLSLFLEHLHLNDFELLCGLCSTNWWQNDKSCALSCCSTMPHTENVGFRFRCHWIHIKLLTSYLFQFGISIFAQSFYTHVHTEWVQCGTSWSLSHYS